MKAYNVIRRGSFVTRSCRSVTGSRTLPRINYLELLHAFHVDHNSNDLAEQMHEDLLEGIYRVLYFKFRNVVAPALEEFMGACGEVGGEGKPRCTPTDFGIVISAVNNDFGGQRHLGKAPR